MMRDPTMRDRVVGNPPGGGWMPHTAMAVACRVSNVAEGMPARSHPAVKPGDMLRSVSRSVHRDVQRVVPSAADSEDMTA